MFNKNLVDQNNKKDIGTKGVSGQSGTQNLGGGKGGSNNQASATYVNESHNNDASDIGGGMRGNDNNPATKNISSNSERSEGGYLQSDIYNKDKKDKNLTASQNNPSGRSIS